MEGETAVIDMDACVGCGACANVCSEDAVTLVRRMGKVFKTKELRVDDDLVLHVVFARRTVQLKQ